MNSFDAKKAFGNKKITLMGLGLLGRGIGDARFFASSGADLIITDLKTEEELAPSIAKLKGFTNITYHLGDHHLEDFENRDLIIKAPNTPLDSPFIAHARESGVPVEMDAALFVKLCRSFCNAKIVGITGTRGKSTTTHLIYEMIKKSGAHVFLGGNEKDTATLPLIETVEDDDIVVLELDSWQLQGFAEDQISPDVSVWTNFMSDHMNYYKNDMGRYFGDKAAIARFQKEGDFFVTGPEIKNGIESQYGTLHATCVTDASLPSDWEIALPGEHNRQNAACAVAAVRALGIGGEIIKEVLKTFVGLPGRLEYLGEKRGISFYNDSNATTPDAAIVALRTLAAKQKPIILIAGGSDKELAFGSMAREIKEKVKSLVLFKGKATEKLKVLLPDGFVAKYVETMSEACAAALDLARSGDIILLSPGATSFGIFKNEYDRGDQFKKWVESL